MLKRILQNGAVFREQQKILSGKKESAYFKLNLNKELMYKSLALDLQDNFLLTQEIKTILAI